MAQFRLSQSRLSLLMSQFNALRVRGMDIPRSILLEVARAYAEEVRCVTSDPLADALGYAAGLIGVDIGEDTTFVTDAAALYTAPLC